MIKYYRKTLTSLFQSLNDLRTNPANIDLCFSIQEKLLNHIRRIEYQIRKIKSNNSEIQNLIKNGRLPKEESKKLKQRIEYNILKKNSYDRLLLIFRDVGDGVAFIYLDKWDIKPLCLSKEPAGFVSGKKGLKLELKIFRKLKLSKFPFIFCDVTNSVRYSDIVIVKHGIPLFLEIKSGKSSASNERALRQKENIQKLAKYLIIDEADDLFGLKGKVTRISTVKKEKHYRKSLNTLIEKAGYSRNNVMNKIEKGLYYAILYSEERESFEKVINKLPKSGKWILSNVNEQKKYKQSYYPFTLSIIDPERLFEFYVEEFSIIIFIDLNIVEEICSKESVVMAFHGDEQSFISFSYQEEGTLTMSSHLFGRVCAEFLSLEWMITESFNRLFAIKKEFRA
ncbi:MAG: hypothetical protein V4612_04010 [Pseudomonadota bacterium]